MTHDLKLAFRTIWKRPFYAVSVIAVMALSIGACTAVFSIFNAVLLAPLPFQDAGRLAIIWHTLARKGAGVIGMSPANFVSYRDNATTVESVAAITTRGFNIGLASQPMRVTCARVSANLLPILGVTPAQGRWFTTSDDRDGAEKTIIISHQLWATHFSSSQNILGSRVTLDLNPYTLIGVMPESFRFPLEGINGLEPASCFVPMAFSQKELGTPSFNIVVLARLKPGVTISQADSDANVIAKSILESYPAAVQRELDLRARVVPLASQISSSSRTAVVVFAIAVGFLLLLGCANVANLALVRMQERQRDLVIRTALGSSRFELAKQTVTECAVLALTGGLAGIAFAWQFLQIVQALNPGNVPRLQDARIDLQTLAFTLVCSLGAGLLVSLLPSLRTAVPSLSGALMTTTRGASAGVSGTRLRGVLMALETAITLVLLIGAVLLLRSFLKLGDVAPGFVPDRVLTFSVALPHDAYQKTTQVDAFTGRLLTEIRSMPSVTSAACGSSLPLMDTEFTAVSRPAAPEAAAGFKVAAIQTVTPDYHQALGISLKRGRLLQLADSESSATVAVINETMAKRYWPDKDPISDHFTWIATSGPRTLTVVGIVQDVHETGLDQDPQPLFYIPLAQAPQPPLNLSFAVKTAGPPQGVASAIRMAVAGVDTGLPIFAMQPMDEVVGHSLAKQRFSALLIGLFACSAVIIAGLGIYAVIAYLASTSAREIAIRSALGGQSFDIVAMIMRRGLSWVGLGIGTGLVTAIVLNRFMSALLFDISGTDITTFVGVSALLLVISAAAMAVPARRATRVDPVIVLRHE